MRIRIKGARILDPGHFDDQKDLIIENTIIKDLLEPGSAAETPGETVIDADDMIVVPGLIDVHVHLREPGHEYKETIETGVEAAAAGGFTAVCSMPNTNPVNDNTQVTQFIINQASEIGRSRVYPTGAITKGSEGSTLAEIFDMKKAGIVAVTDDGLPVSDTNVMRHALEYCKGLHLPVFVHAEDLSIADGGAMNEGPSATYWGIKGIPNAAESIMVLRDIALSELTGTHVHFCHISTCESVDAIRQAKKRGVNVTCETAPHYFTLIDEDIKDYDTNFKMNPPLRSRKDREAIINGLSDGTIDMIASDHAPHSILEKDVEFDRAAFGIIGLETSLALGLKLVHQGILSLENLISKMSKKPAELIGINNDIKKGSTADLTIIDLDDVFQVDPKTFKSKSKNTPFSGMELKGRAYTTIVDGKIVYQKK